MNTCERPGVAEGPPPEMLPMDARDLGPYLRALQMARADLLTGQIQGERAQSRVDEMVDQVLNQFFVREPDRSLASL